MTVAVYDLRALIEDVEFLADTRETFDRAAVRLGVSRTALEKRLRTAGRTDLLGRLGGYQAWVVDRQRRARAAA